MNRLLSGSLSCVLPALLLSALAGCVCPAEPTVKTDAAPVPPASSPAAAAVAAPEPPMPQSEEVVMRPGFIWARGHWMFKEGKWFWHDGFYMRERSGYVWVDGRWERQDSGWFWHEGSWTSR